MFNSILFVCVGNICRSPMAEGLYRHNLEKLSKNIKISSAGMHALVDRSAASEAQQLMSERGIDISQHRARQITAEIALNADLILVMEEEQKREMECIYHNVRGRVFLLGHWGGYEIYDPYKMDIKEFQNCLDLVEQSWQEWLYKL